VIDAAFAQRRKTLRAALAALAGSPQRAEAALTAVGIDPRHRGEELTVTEFVAVAAALDELAS
jgi:16S rRNA (adenine1518-N6/adenine1519-N6)-dimethyltransferase